MGRAAAKSAIKEPSLGASPKSPTAPRENVSIIAFAATRLLALVIPPPGTPRHDEIREVVKSIRIGSQQLFHFFRAENNYWLNKPYHSTKLNPLLTTDIFVAAQAALAALQAAPAVGTIDFTDELGRRIDLDRLKRIDFCAPIHTMVTEMVTDDDALAAADDEPTEATSELDATESVPDDLALTVAGMEGDVTTLQNQVGSLEAKLGRAENEIVELQARVDALDAVNARLDALEAAAKRKVTVKIEDEDEEEAGPSAPATPPEPAPEPEPRPSRMTAARAKRARKA